MTELRGINIKDAAATSNVHLLQGCSINFTGEAPVSEFFQPVTTDAQCNGAPILETTFRGRFMKGCELALPDGFSGAILERRENASGDTDEPTTSWHATDTFSSFTYWNHDTAPVKTDSIRRAMEWAALSSHIHKPVTAEQVQEEMETAAAAAEKDPPIPISA